MTGFDFAIGGFPLTGVDEYGCDWHTEEAAGWFAGGQVRNNTVPRSQQPGDWRGQGMRGGRVVTLRGHVSCPDLAVLDATARRFSAILADGGFDQLLGVSPNLELSTMVQLEDTPLFDPLSDRAAAWQITVGSESNLLFGPATFEQTTLAASAGGGGRVWPRAWPRDWGLAPGVTPGAITLPNAGTTSYHPRLRIDGGVTNPRITLAETGDLIALNYDIPEGQWVDINAGKPREVLLNGVVSLRNRVSFVGNWCAIPVGGGSLTWTADAFTTTHSLSAWGNEGAWQ